MIKRDLQVLSVRQEARNYGVTCRQILDDYPNSLAKSLFQEQITIVGLSGITLQIYQLDFNWYSAKSLETIINQL